ncbi:MAG: hypothetical protein JXR94_22050 [Candidatus Hydrogenedentes bacterium]|nr:hypothetical protein [Candidatus Hydrogenedentota bacterium]
MDDRVSSETRKQIQALCRKISVAHHLDAEIQEELSGHMEDKLAAYLDGEEALSEQDAFILVREHFGDPAALKGLLQDVHVHEAHVSLARRLAVAFAVTTGVHAVFVVAARALLHVWPALRGFGGFQALLAVIAVATAVASWLFLLRLQRGLAAGRTPWLLTRRPAYLAGIAAVLSLMQSLAPISAEFGASGPVMGSMLVWRLTMVAMVASPLLQCVLWLWWCDRPPRRVRTAVTVAGVWALCIWLTSCAGAFLRPGVLSGVPSPHVIAQSLAVLAYALACALAACGLYAVARCAATGLARASIARR